MKKLIKRLYTLGAITGALAIANQIIFKIADLSETTEDNSQVYKWRHGKIRYIEAGQGEPLLLLHGIGVGCDINEWEQHIYVLAKHYHVYAFDFLGFGHSDKPPISYSAYLYIMLICDFVNDIIKSPTAVIADSIAADYAIMATAFRPGIFTKMMLIAPTGARLKLPSSTNRIRLIKTLIELPVYGTFFYNLLSSRLYGSTFLKESGFYNRCKVNRIMVNKFYFSAHYKGYGAKYPIATFLSNQLYVDVKEALKKISIPIHVLWGDQNNLSRVSTYNIIENLCPNAELTVFENAKALPHVEYPKKFYKLCIEFLGK